MFGDEEAPRQPKAGRRAGGRGDANPETDRLFNEQPEAQQPSARKGWGDEGGSVVVDPPQEPALPSYDDGEAIEEVQPDKGDEGIPELEPQAPEAALDDLTKMVAEAPKGYTGAKVPELSELEEDAKLPPLKDLSSGKMEIDLSLLSRCLMNVTEEDTYWDPNLLFTQLSSELQTEKENDALAFTPNQP